ncbi:transmembrane protein 135-like [Topomyia yanbarensis]|uniref:transmembrane protein 135-like n=1 Tax=Topomyia yanbarensis TaxID=2498891 RepID=UPI00273AFDA3|nr:transmembrane protein 135-like [Topomyia yanbarensis]
MQVLSKLNPVPLTCKEYVHPWTDSCSIASAVFMTGVVQNGLRFYTAVYMLSLAMQGRLPTIEELKRTVRGVLQSTAFLAMFALSYTVFLCAVRRLVGSYNFYTASSIPAFLAAFCAILVERPSRRGLLGLYAANVATETGWNILKSRGLVRSIPYGEILIFGLSTSILLYYYRLNRQKDYNDSMFDVFRFALGDSEIMKSEELTEVRRESRTKERPRAGVLSYSFIQSVLKVYSNVTSRIETLGKHALCRHKHSCIYSMLSGGGRMFSIGLGIQVIMKVLFQARRIIRRPKLFRRTFLRKDIFKLGMFLGGFTSLYKLSSCLLRHTTNNDKAEYAIPSGLITCVVFGYYADTTIALYMMWKMLQMTYNWGIEKGYVPKVPGFTVLLFCVSTALIFHAATMEPMQLRPSYWKFLYSISGGRAMLLDRSGFDVYGVGTSRQIREMIELCNTPAVRKFRI